MLLLFILGQLHVHHIYHWMADGIADPNSPHYDEIIAGKIGYFGWFWWVRTLLYTMGWLWFTMKLRSNSLAADQMDTDPGNRYHWKNVKLGAWFMVLFAVTSSTSSWDWVMSIDTHWFSTLFGWYIFAGMWISALTMITMLIIWLKRLGYLSEVTESTIHDMGKWMFAISFLWTYLYFSQFMLIWYADIPEEVVYFQTRWESYKALMWTVLFVNLSWFVYNDTVVIIHQITASINFHIAYCSYIFILQNKCTHVQCFASCCFVYLLGHVYLLKQYLTQEFFGI